MNLYVQEENYACYGGGLEQSFRRMGSFQGAVNLYCASKNTGVTYDTSVVPKKFLRAEKHVLVVDVDSNTAMESATAYIKEKITTCYALVESSPGRYWIIVNKIDTIGNLIRIMSSIPGVDEKFVFMCYLKQRIHVRACPKYHLSKPLFRDIDTERLKDGDARVYEWYNGFKTFIDSKYYQAMHDNLKLRSSATVNSELYQ